MVRWNFTRICRKKWGEWEEWKEYLGINILLLKVIC